MIDILFPRSVVTMTATPEMWDGRVYSEEEVCIAGAVAKRRREFTAGRLCARAALARLGIERFPVLARADRTPIWPPGIVGSLSHCDGYCAVAIARHEQVLGIGLDVERGGPLAAGIARIVCTPAELVHHARLPCEAAIDWTKLAFSAKECAYKCYYPLTSFFLEFHDVEVTIRPAEREFTAVLGPRVPALPDGGRRLRGRFAYTAAYVATGIVLDRRLLRLEPHSQRDAPVGR